MDSRAGLVTKATNERSLAAAPAIAQRELENGLTILVQSDFTAPVFSGAV